MLWRRVLRMVKAEPTEAERAAVAKAERTAREDEWKAQRAEEARRWEEAQAEEWRARVEASNAALAAQLERQGYLDVGFSADAGELPTINLGDGEPVALDIFGRPRRFSNLGRWLGR